MLFIVVLFLFVFLVANGFILLEEETLIILASIVWVDAAGGAIKSALDSELLIKADTIKKKFVWFLSNKKKLILELQELHMSRVLFYNELERLNLFFIPTLVGYSLISFLNNAKVVEHSAAINYLHNLSLTFYTDTVAGIDSQKNALVGEFGEQIVKYKQVSGHSYCLGHLDIVAV